MRDLQRFEVIGRAKELTLRCYRLTSRLPGSERFGLVSQMNRAAVSIAANLAEGVGRGTQGDFERHLRIGQGSAAELRVLTELASDLHSLPDGEVNGFIEVLDSLRRQLTRLTVKVSEER